RTRRHVGRVRRELYDQRLSGSSPDRSEERLEAGWIGPDVQPSLDVRTGDVQLERRDLRARVARLEEPRELLRRGAHHVRDEGDRRGLATAPRGGLYPRQLGEILGEAALEPLVGQAD